MKSFFILLISILLLNCSEPKPDLKFSASNNREGITIKNNDVFDYVNAEVEVNGIYKYDVSILKSGYETIIYYSNLVDEKGTRFDFDKVRPQQIVVSFTDKDNNFYYGSRGK